MFPSQSLYLDAEQDISSVASSLWPTEYAHGTYRMMSPVSKASPTMVSPAKCQKYLGLKSKDCGMRRHR